MTDILKWNTIAKEYTDWLENQTDKKGFVFNQSLINALLRRLPSNSNLKLLDLGCGDGLYVSLLNNSYTKVEGIDGSEKMIQIAKEKYPRLAECFRVVDITKQFPIDDNSFDVLLCNMVLMDLHEIEKTLKETSRVLKYGGVFILTIVHPCFNYVGRHPLNQNNRYVDNFQYEKILDTSFNYSINHYHRPIQFYVDQILKAGFTIKGFEEISIDTNDQEELKKYHFTANALLIESHKLC